MKNIIILFIIFLTGCGSTKYYVKGEEGQTVLAEREVVVVENQATRSGFLSAITNWLDENNFSYSVTDEKPVDKPYLRYEGKWSWDLTIYLRNGFISLYDNGRLRSRCRIEVPNNLNLSKFNKGEKKIENMMDLLFYHDSNRKIKVIYE